MMNPEFPVQQGLRTSAAQKSILELISKNCMETAIKTGFVLTSAHLCSFRKFELGAPIQCHWNLCCYLTEVHVKI